MRFILSFVIGFLAFFYLGELVRRILKRTFPSWPGLSLIAIAIILILFRPNLLQPPLNSLLPLFILGAGLGLTFFHLLNRRYIVSERVELTFVKKHETFFERALEIFPGAMTWTILTSPIWLSYTFPFAVAYLIILADVYWLFSAFKNAIFIFLGYRKIEWARKEPWFENLKKDFPQWEKYYHLILLPRFNEGLEVVGPAIDAVISSNFPKDKIFLAIGSEERVNNDQTKAIDEYARKKGKGLAGVLLTLHPFELPGEVPGPATNRNWMVKNALKVFKEKGIQVSQVLVTTLDSDFVIHQEFLASALHKYLSTPADIRNKRTYTGSFLYYNNYWQAPALTRMVAVGTGFWQVSEMVYSDKYMNFSSLSINLKALLDLGLWIPNKVNDDSGFYWKAYYHFKGNYKVIPHFVPIYADAVLDVNLLKTVQNQYLQLKRWAYGVEHVPFIFKEYFRHTDIDFWDKTDKLIFALWGYLRWGTLALFVSFAGLLIPIINPDYKQSVLAVNLPVVSSYILTAAFLGLISTIYVHEKTVPKRPANWGFLKRAWSYLQFLLVPIIVVTISALPSIDAQTSLMLGRRLQFRTTTKVRLSTS